MSLLTFFSAVRWTDAAVQAAMLSSCGSIISTAIGATCASIIGKKFADRARLKRKLKDAVADIEFMLAVEAEHCEHNKQAGLDSSKRRVREAVRARGLQWSGQFTPGRAADSRTLNE